jgi:hypothetical protein
MKWIGALFFLSLATQLFSQNVLVKGRITDGETGEGVSFAHVGVCGKSIGVVANENGLFEFRIPDHVINDSLCATAIGYETFRAAIASLSGQASVKIELNPQVSYLDEIMITNERITGRRVVAKAISRIQRNYPKSPFNLKGYYRDYIRKNDEYISFLEGVISIDDKGFRKPTGKSKIKIEQLRYSKNYIKYFSEFVSDFDKDSTKVLQHGISPVFKGNEFSNLYYHNPIRNHNKSVPFIGVFDTFSERSYDFEIEYYTYVDDQEVYVISVSPASDFRFTHVSIEGRLYIRTDNYAIVKFDYAYFVSRWLETKKWFQLNVEYREFEGKMYLKYFSFMNYFKLLTIEEAAEMYVFREFFVNEIQADEYRAFDEAECIDQNLPLYRQNAPTEQQFWMNYSRTLLEQPLME